MQQSIEDINEKNEAIVRTCMISNAVYWTAHVAYLIFFLVLKCYVLVYINIGSILIYSSFFLLIKNKKYNLYARGCGVEILSYMTASTVLCGLDCGFHLCIIGLCIVAFYSGYFAKKVKVSRLPVIWSIFSCVVYIVLCSICHYYGPFCKLEYWAVSLLFIVHTLIVFGFITGYLWAFTQYVVRLEGRIKKESRTDKLTSIPNRYAMYNYLDSLDDKNKYMLSIFDIDNFKKINDIYGHLCGDYILKKIADIASRNSLTDFVARYGGEEFVLISTIDNSIEDTLKKIDRIRVAVETFDFEFEDQVIHATITFGVAEYTDGMTMDEWIEVADQKLYEGKNSGKNKLVF